MLVTNMHHQNFKELERIWLLLTDTDFLRVLTYKFSTVTHKYSVVGITVLNQQLNKANIDKRQKY